MNTYRGGTGWTASTWPSSPGTADTTTWAYQEATGLLSSKTDAVGKAVSYTYTQAGQMATRVWARILSGSTHVTTTYAYSSTTGELTSVDYNDSTPDLAYSYNRAGNTAQVTDTTGTRTFNYNLSGTLELQSEDLPTYFGSRRITYPVASSGVIGRPTGLQLGTSGSPTSEQSITYGYDTYGRFNSLAGGGTTLAYAYTSNSNLLASIADSVSGWTQTRTYLSNRDLLDVIETKVSTTSKAKFDYAHDNLGRRTGVNKTGGLYSRYGNGTQGLDTTWGYDDRSQVTAEQSYLGGTATTLTGRVDAYAWDNIGNRSSTAGTTHNGGAAAYSANALNQYRQRDVVSVFDVAGAAGSGTTVTVNTSSAGVTRHGEYFFKGHSLTNTSNPVYSTLAISDGTTTTNLPAFLAKTAEVFSYDDEGNLIRDGRWVYQYDAENRLTAMFTRGAPADPQMSDGDSSNDAPNTAVWNSGVARQKLQFTYDYLGRRVDKLVSNWNPVTSTWDPATEERFVYSGWNAIAKLNALSSNALVASYYWGLDWSGTLQGAGGVGGLALIVEGGSTYLPMFDGNGNVMGLIKASTGSIDAAYEFDAFGNTIRESGTYAASNPFRFSTKYTDVETSLVYYGLRYYSPSLGRFINKDPIEEAGGLNLYGFCGNSSINGWDYLGMDTWGLGVSGSLGAVFYMSGSAQFTLSYNAQQLLSWREWSVGFSYGYTKPLVTESQGTPGAGISLIGSFSPVNRTEMLNGKSFFVGAGGGEGLSLGLDISNLDLGSPLGPQLNPRTGTANYTGSFGLWGGLPIDVHGGMQDGGGGSISAGGVADAVKDAGTALGTIMQGGSVLPRSNDPYGDPGQNLNGGTTQTPVVTPASGPTQNTNPVAPTTTHAGTGASGAGAGYIFVGPTGPTSVTPSVSGTGWDGTVLVLDTFSVTAVRPATTAGGAHRQPSPAEFRRYYEENGRYADNDPSPAAWADARAGWAQNAAMSAWAKHVDYGSWKNPWIIPQGN